jgi:hypothetical protein
MIGKERISEYWNWLLVAAFISGLVAIAIVLVIFSFDFWWIFSALLIIPAVLYLKWEGRLVVDAEFNLIAEWKGEKVEPLTPGIYYPFRYGDFFKLIAKVPMNIQTLHILSGEREGLKDDIVKLYLYGTASNMEPGTGDSVRLLYKLEFKCLNPIALVYTMDNPYDYLAGETELEVSQYIHKNTSEDIVDNFSREGLAQSPDLNIVPKIKDDVLNKIGVEVIAFIPVDVILTPEKEALRRAQEREDNRKPLIESQLANAVVEEAGQAQILQAQLNNMEIKKNIAKEHNEIMSNKINKIKADTGVDGATALQFYTKQRTIDVVADASKTGSITYIDDSSNSGTLSQAAALGWAIKSNNNNS